MSKSYRLFDAESERWSVRLVRSVVVVTAFSAMALADGCDLAAAGPASHRMGSSLYFNVGGYNCSIDPNGSVGCDIAPAAPVMDVSFTGESGPQYAVPYAPAVVIDESAWPAHPQWVGAGAHTLPGGNPPLPSIGDANPADPTQNIVYAGADCQAGFHGAVSCTAMGHGFTFVDGQVEGH